MDLRYFELHDLLCETLIALEAGNQRSAATKVRQALDWVKADWLATPSALPRLRDHPRSPATTTPTTSDGASHTPMSACAKRPYRHAESFATTRDDR